MTPREATELIGGIWSNGRGLGPCPVAGHGKGRGDVNPSLSISAGDRAELLVHCFAGCDPIDIIASLRELSGGIGEERSHVPSAQASSFRSKTTSHAARSIWNRGTLLSASVAEVYLRSRGLSATSPELRFLHGERHPLFKDRCLPTLLAALRGGDGRITAVQRTYLTSSGEKAHICPARTSIGRLDASAVQLTPASQTLGLAEGVETALAAHQLFGVPVWAACGARLHRVALPPSVRRVILFADNDAPGLETAHRALDTLKEAELEGLIRTPDQEGWDWADVLSDTNDV